MPRNDVKAYGSVIARLPQDLLDQVKQYAALHRCSVSELIRDGLEMRLESGEVPGRSTGPHGETGDEVLHEVLQAVKALAPMPHAALEGTIRQTITEVLHEVLPIYVSRQEEHREGMTEVLQGITEVIPYETPSTAPTGKGITEVIPLVPTLTPVAQVTEGHTTVIPMVPAAIPPAPEVLPGDTSPPQAPTPSTEGGMTEVVQGSTEVLPHHAQVHVPEQEGRAEVVPKTGGAGKSRERRARQKATARQKG